MVRVCAKEGIEGWFTVKSSLLLNSVFYANVGRPRRPPLRTFKEFAEEFGIADAKFAAALAEPGAPRPVFRLSNKNTTSNRWYEAHEMRKWWSERNAN